jgi:transcriptional regulator with XRE-family HTH domain
MTSKTCYAGDMPGRPATKPTPAFGARLAALRQARGWSQVEFARRLGVTVKLATYFEREARNPTAKTIARIAEALGVDPVALLGEPTPKRAAKPGPPSQLEQRIAALRALPRERQKFVVEMLDTVLRAERAAS